MCFRESAQRESVTHFSSSSPVFLCHWPCKQHAIDFKIVYLVRHRVRPYITYPMSIVYVRNSISNSTIFSLISIFSVSKECGRYDSDRQSLHHDA